jgi:hypothetical protein
LLKLEWLRLNRELRQAKDADLDGFIADAEIDYEEELRREHNQDHVPKADDVMVDALEQEEEAEIDALVSSLPSDMELSQVRPDSPHFSDDDDYDALFNEVMTQEIIGHGDGPVLSQDMDMS